MRMPEPEEDKVTATGGGMRASGLLKLGAVRRSLLKKGLFVLQCALTESFHAVCCCACVLFFDRATRLSRLRLRAASNRAQETSELSTCLCARPHCACVCLVIICTYMYDNYTFSQLDVAHTDLGVPFLQFSSFCCAIFPGVCLGSTVGLVVPGLNCPFIQALSK